MEVRPGRIVLVVCIVDLEPPRQVGRLAVELLVPPVAEAADRLRQQERGRDDVHRAQHAPAGALDHPGAREHAEEDPAPDPEATLPDLEDALPLRVGDVVPGGDDVVEPRADDPGRDAPHGDPEDQVGVALAPAPAPARQEDGGDDRDEQRQPVRVNRR